MVNQIKLNQDKYDLCKAEAEARFPEYKAKALKIIADCKEVYSSFIAEYQAELEANGEVQDEYLDLDLSSKEYLSPLFNKINLANIPADFAELYSDYRGFEACDLALEYLLNQFNSLYQGESCKAVLIEDSKSYVASLVGEDSLV